MIINCLSNFDNIHTHVLEGPKAICSVPPRKAMELCRDGENQPYSIELHPWKAGKDLLEEFNEAIDFCKDDSNFIAIGECGLDSICDTDMSVQEECFVTALQAGKRLGKPMIIHIVRAWDKLLKLIDEYGDTDISPIVIHGYRKNETFAQQLIKKGFYLSLGKKYNEEVPKLIPADRIFHETDEITEEK